MRYVQDGSRPIPKRLIIKKPTWYPLESRRTGKKNAAVTGEVLMEFSVFDPIHSSATPQQILQKLYATIGAGGENDDEDDLTRIDTGDLEDEEEGDEDLEQAEGADGDTKEEALAKKKKRRRVARIKRRTKQRAYEFSGLSDVAGVLFLEVQKITDLPPERNGMCFLSMAHELLTFLQQLGPASTWIHLLSLR